MPGVCGDGWEKGDREKCAALNKYHTLHLVVFERILNFIVKYI